MLSIVPDGAYGDGQGTLPKKQAVQHWRELGGVTNIRKVKWKVRVVLEGHTTCYGTVEKSIV